MAIYHNTGLFDLDEALSTPLHLVNFPSPMNVTTLSNNNNIPLSFRADQMLETPLMMSFPVMPQNDVLCSVCMENFKPPRNGFGRQIRCGHVYHAHCIATWLSVCKTCPLCRVTVDDPNEGL